MLRLFKKNQKGFTLIEMLVTVSIVITIIAIIVVNQSTYFETAAVSNLADEISLSLAQSQAYGIAVKELTPGSEDFSAAYGMVFSLTSQGSNSSYLFFADRNDNGYYDDEWECEVGGSSECLMRRDLYRSITIDSLCVVPLSGSEDCSVGRIDVRFVRPETKAEIMFFNMSGTEISPSSVKGAKIIRESPSGMRRSVTVYENGQISVQ